MKLRVGVVSGKRSVLSFPPLPDTGPDNRGSSYVREDHLLNDLRTRFAETAGDDGSAIADYLRTNDLTITCGGPTREIKACGPSRAIATMDETVGDQLLLL